MLLSWQAGIVNAIVGYRNAMSANVSGSLSGGYSFPSASGTAPAPFDQSILSNTTGFLSFSGTASPTNSQTDRPFTSRQSLIRFLTQGVAQSQTERAALQTTLEYFGTFSRELDQPSYAPPSGRPKVSDLKWGGR